MCAGVSWKLQEIRACLEVNNCFQRSAERHPHNRIPRGQVIFFEVSSAQFVFFRKESYRLPGSFSSSWQTNPDWLWNLYPLSCRGELGLFRNCTDSSAQHAQSWTHRRCRAEKQIDCACTTDLMAFFVVKWAYKQKKASQQLLKVCFFSLYVFSDFGCNNWGIESFNCSTGSWKIQVKSENIVHLRHQTQKDFSSNIISPHFNQL